MIGCILPTEVYSIPIAMFLNTNRRQHSTVAQLNEKGDYECESGIGKKTNKTKQKEGKENLQKISHHQYKVKVIEQCMVPGKESTKRTPQGK